MAYNFNSVTGKSYTWKVVYHPRVLQGGVMGVALVEAENRQMAMRTFMQQYAGQFCSVTECKKLFE